MKQRATMYDSAPHGCDVSAVLDRVVRGTRDKMGGEKLINPQCLRSPLRRADTPGRTLANCARRVGLLDRRSFNRGVFPGKRAQNHALCWAENGSGRERIMNADLAPRLIAFPVLTHRLAR